MKKILMLALFYIGFTVFALNVVRNDNNNLYLLNWGEYIDPNLVEKFEEMYDVSIVLEEVGSSEEMYQKVSMGATKYDVAIPSDYIIEKMHKDNLLYELDFSKLSNYKTDMLCDNLQELTNNFFTDNQKYTIPYFWGTYAIIYQNLTNDLKSIIEEHELDVFFNRDILPTNTKVGMYDIPRWAVTSYMLNNNLDINSTVFSKETSSDIITKIKKMDYDLWGDDLLKKQIANGNLDIAFVQLGDFFDQYYVSTSSGNEANFSCHIPTNTAAFFDGMVIPKTSKNIDLAHKFIDFFLDTNNAFENTSYVGYSPCFKEVIDMVKNDDSFAPLIEKYPFYINPTMDNNATLFKDLGVEYQTMVEKMINEAKS